MLKKVRMTVSLFFHPFAEPPIKIPEGTEIYVDESQGLGHYDEHTFDIHPSEYMLTAE